MKKILLLFIYLLAFSACDVADKEGWLKGVDSSYQYKFLTPKNNGHQVNFGDELYLSYTIYKGDSILEQAPKDEYLILPMPTIEHRNPWENALMNATVGDSIAVRAIYKTVTNSMHRFADFFEREDWISCHFKVYKINTRQALLKEQEENFSETYHFSSYEAMNKENKAIVEQRSDLEKSMLTWVNNYSFGSLKDLLKDTENNVQYEILPPQSSYDLLNKNAVPKSNDTVLIHYIIMKMSDREIFDNSLMRTTRLEFVVDKDLQYLPAFHLAVKRLAVGENAFFVMPSNLCYGEEGSLPVVPPNTPLILYVHLVGVLDK